MIKNYNKSSIVLASNCREDKSVFRLVKNLTKKKFPNETNLKVALITTARMGFRDKKRSILLKNTKKMTEKFEYEKRLGLPLEYIDCSRKKNYEKFEKTIKECKIIWIIGGDTLYLLYHLKKSGFINLLKKRIMNDNIIFVGCCAGAIISGKSIKPVFIDRTRKIKLDKYMQKKTKYYLKNTYKKKFWQKKNNIQCLNLVQNLDVVPHCDHRNKKRISTLKKHKMYCLPERKQLII